MFKLQEMIQEARKPKKTFAKYDNMTVMKKSLLTTSPDLLIAPPGMEIIDYLEIPTQLPSWITEEELQVYASKFKVSGFTGGLNYYRAIKE
ncbi:bifunctional epoxide hydrolase 2-like protein [Tanacetum coccineum]